MCVCEFSFRFILEEGLLTAHIRTLMHVIVYTHADWHPGLNHTRMDPSVEPSILQRSIPSPSQPLKQMEGGNGGQEGVNMKSEIGYSAKSCMAMYIITCSACLQVASDNAWELALHA